MGNEQGRVLSPEEVRAKEIAQMDSEVKKKLSQIVIKGDRNTGKTCLWRRLQGLNFIDEYLPTPEIQVAHINWNYKASDEVVKVEVWDVVDKAKPKKKETGLKISSSDPDLNFPDEEDDNTEITLPPVNTMKGSFTISPLDAVSVDVMKGTSAVIIMVDPTKIWTWEYAKKELEKIPPDIYTLILANCRDRGAYRQVSEKEIQDFCEIKGGLLKYIEASMLNGYGLKSVIKFFNIPFLYLQRQYIQAQLDRNTVEIQCAEDELKAISNDHGYDFYLKWMETKRLEQRKKSSIPVRTPDPAVPPTLPKSTSPPIPQPSPPPTTQTSPRPIAQSSPAPLTQPSPSHATPSNRPPTPQSSPPLPPPTEKPAESATKSTWDSKSATGTGETPTTGSGENSNPPPVSTPISVDSFKPGEIDDDFFGERPSRSPPSKTQAKKLDRDEDVDEETPNPLVAKDESVDEFSTPSTQKPPKTFKQTKQIQSVTKKINPDKTNNETPNQKDNTNLSPKSDRPLTSKQNIPSKDFEDNSVVIMQDMDFDEELEAKPKSKIQKYPLKKTRIASSQKRIVEQNQPINEENLSVKEEKENSGRKEKNTHIKEKNLSMKEENPTAITKNSNITEKNPRTHEENQNIHEPFTDENPDIHEGNSNEDLDDFFNN